MTDGQARTILRSVYPELAMKDDQVAGSPVLWTRASPLRASGRNNEQLLFQILGMGWQHDTAWVVFSVSSNNAVQDTFWSQATAQSPCDWFGSVMHLYQRDTTRELLFGSRSIGQSDSLVGTLAWLPYDLFAWAPVADSLTELAKYFREQVVRKQEQTDNAFWHFHEKETGVGNTRYFAGSFTDAQVDSIRQSGADIYYMGTKSAGKTALRGYGK